ncbi:MAG: ATP-dependent DNA helicase [Clostridia bacterium]|nr:ATP-dependent DNA helicase [Clostridia bacterium]
MNYSRETETVYLTFDELYTLAARSGDLADPDPIFDRPKAAEAMREAALKKRPAARELVPVSCRVRRGGVSYAVTAEAEMLERDGGRLTIHSFCAQGGRSEIDDRYAERKGTRLAALCGVFAVALADEEPEIEAHLTIRAAFGRPPEHFRVSADLTEMKECFFSLIDGAADFIAFEIERQKTRIPSSAALKFPYPKARKGQSDFMTEAYRTISRGGRFLCEAPTGIGKTVSALFPAVKALGKEKADKVFYFTPKTTTQYAAIEALRAISGKALALRSIALCAKEKLCAAVPNRPAPQETEEGAVATGSRCEHCPCSRGHYDRVGEAILFLMDRTRFIQKEDILAAAKKYSVCPYELSLDVSEYCDVIVCDYNYLFDARVYLRRYFDNDARVLSSCVTRENYVFLIDEAHNLPERAKSMYSHRLKPDAFLPVLSAFGKTDKEIEAMTALNALCDRIRLYRSKLSDAAAENEHGEPFAYYVSERLDREITEDAEAFVRLIDEMRRARTPALPSAVLDAYYDLKDFLAKAAWFSQKFRAVAERYGEKISYRIYCMDPSEIISEHLDFARATVLFSATLSPVDYYAALLGSPDAATLILDSPYERENLLLTVFDRLSTRYVNREETAEAIVEIIADTVRARVGNYIVYFPSYQYLTGIYDLFREKHPDVPTLVQSKIMSEWDKERYIDAFLPDPQKTLVGFCVLGGVFAEGIDLVGKRLIGTVIVGVGLPRVSLERDLLARYYADTDRDGFLYSYVYPGFTRVLQAAGRVIRSETDRGAVVLLDERFAEPRYRALFPTHWRHAKFVLHTRTLKRLLSDFWEQEE